MITFIKLRLAPTQTQSESIIWLNLNKLVYFNESMGMIYIEGQTGGYRLEKASFDKLKSLLEKVTEEF